MQALGELLRTTREERGYTMDQVVHETNISRSYIEDLEGERFDNFPAEAYLIGFLRTYADYLGLDPDKTISLYRNHKLREEPSPIEALVGKKKKKVSPLVFIVAGAVIVLAAAVYFLAPPIANVLSERSAMKEQNRDEKEVRAPKEWKVEGEITEFHALDGDTVVFTKGDRTVRYTVTDMDNGINLKVSDDPEHPGFFFSLGKEVFFSLFRDSPDYRVFLKDYGFSQGGGVLVVQEIAQAEIDREESDVVLDTELMENPAPSGEQSRTVDPVIIYTVPSGERYTLDIRFRGYCLLRYKRDFDEPIQKYYKDGDTLRVEVNSRIELWLSNAGAVYGKINGVELDFGDAGEVSAKRIQWAKNESGQYELLLLHVY